MASHPSSRTRAGQAVVRPVRARRDHPARDRRRRLRDRRGHDDVRRRRGARRGEGRCRVGRGRREEATNGGTSGHGIADHNTALPLASFAGVVPENAAELAEAHEPYDATLPPLPPGDLVKVQMTLKDMVVEVAPGVKYNTWAFDGHGAPGPVVHVREGQTVEMTLTNGGAIPHSIDFHAARIAPNIAFRDAKPGESFTFRFTAGDPGVFMYHCGTKPVLAHIANGMYGAIVVQPKEGLPPVDNEYVLVGSEWYMNGDGIAEPASLDMAKARSRMSDWVTFNGYANQYVTHPLTADPGETTRFWVVAAGPTNNVNFHVVGDDLRPRLGELRPDEPAAAGRADGRRPRRRRRGLRRQDRRRGALSLRLARLRGRRPRPGRPAEGRQPEGRRGRTEQRGSCRRQAARRGASAPRRVLARGELPLRRPDLPARQPAAARAARGRAREAAAARPLRHVAGAEPRLRAPEPGDPRARPERDLRHRARATAARRSSRTPTSRAPTASSTRTSVRDEDGLRELFRQFSFPGGIPSHAAPETPGSIHEGGELGYALVHAFGAAFDNPDLLVACVVGDGEAETGPLAASWHSNKFLEPAPRRRRAADPAPERLQDREPDRARADPGAASCSRSSRATAGSRARLGRLRRRGVRSRCTERFAAALDRVLDAIAAIQRGGARRRRAERPRWPMIVLRTPKGWTGPARGRRRARRGHVALAPGAARRRARQPEHLRRLEEWLRSYRPEELFDDDGRLLPELAALAPARRAADEREPARERRRCCCATSSCRTSATTRSRSPAPATTLGEATRVLGGFLRDVDRRGTPTTSASSARRDGVEPARRVFEVTDRTLARRASSRPTSTSHRTGA